MHFINIIHRNTNLIEFLVLENFFRLFGIPVYNSHGNQLNLELAKNDNEVSKRDGVINIAVIGDQADADFIRAINLENIILVSTFNKNLVESPPVIHFPSKMNDKEANKKFFEEIMEPICVYYKQSLEREQDECAIMSEEVEDMIDMFLDCNLIVNWHIPLRVKRYRGFIKDAILKLRELSIKYSRYCNEIEKPHLAYAAINLQYMANRLCMKAKYLPIIKWEDILLETFTLANHYVNKFRRAYFMLGKIYDDSEKNNMLAEKCYKIGMYDGDYYGHYRLARVYEFRFDDKKRAKEQIEFSLKRNPKYYRSIYKQGLYYDDNEDYNEAYECYSSVVSLITDSVSDDYWQPLEMEYYLKSCGRIMGLNRIFKSDDIVGFYERKARRILDSIGDNQFIKDLSYFISDNDKKQKEWYEDIVEDVTQNAKEHFNGFCGRYVGNIE